MNVVNTKKMLITDEGYRKLLYMDTVGLATIGIGHNVANVGFTQAQLQLALPPTNAVAYTKEVTKYADLDTADVHYLLYTGISDACVEALFESDLNIALAAISKAFNYFDKLSDVRQAILVGMSFNMGISTLLQFRMMFSAIEANEWTQAAYQITPNSKMATQVPNRAKRYAKAMVSDNWWDLQN